ncbi:pyrroloquinoline quinone biosynthesis peptide chaperone PqqD [Alsobacter sp. KACC 23698]|uniref:PqqA binding protein n=1 Tax=Alsobacter sp. KACC 23698 TaxID=3149229 RepID=A0AAU7JF73_9HYPH
MTQTPAPIPDDARPKLAKGLRLKHDEVRKAWVLLAPERVIQPNPVAAEILKRCDGERTLSAIVDDLAGAFAAPRDRIDADVRALLSDMAAKRMITL